MALVGVYGFANTSVHDVRRRLAKTDLSVEYFVDQDTELGSPEVVLIPNVGSFEIVMEMMKDAGDYVAVLFDMPVRLDGIKGNVLVDVEEKKKSYRYIFCQPNYPKFIRSVEAALEAGKEFEINMRRPNIIPVLLKSTASSVLQRLQSWKYAISNGLRDEAMEFIVEWFIDAEQSKEKLIGKLENLLGEGSANILFEDDRYERLKVGVLEVWKKKQVEGKNVNVAAVADKHKLSAFDIRYIISLAGRKILNEDITLEEMNRLSKEAKSKKESQE